MKYAVETGSGVTILSRLTCSVTNNKGFRILYLDFICISLQLQSVITAHNLNRPSFSIMLLCLQMTFVVNCKTSARNHRKPFIFVTYCYSRMFKVPLPSTWCLIVVTRLGGKGFSKLLPSNGYRVTIYVRIG
jgi:hypothetical protein